MCPRPRASWESSDMSVRYYKRENDDGELLTLGRVVETDTGLWGEAYTDRGWTEHPIVMTFEIDPLYGDRISEEEADSIIARLERRR